ncbi:MAG: monofunctional biosynthetic peptidoglycan transglycosylase [Bacteroidota bacterium]
MPASTPHADPQRSTPVRWLARGAWLAFWVVAGYFVACALLIASYRVVDPLFTTVHVERWVESWGDEGDYDYRRSTVRLADISDQLERAVVASEDARFYDHHGFDWIEVEKAREAAAQGGRLRGASTISQQLAKNLFLTTDRSWLRKVAEVPLTVLIEALLPKERILELYLNTIEWGPDGVFGAEAAAQAHYGIAAADLSRNQAARLAAIVPAPRTRAPHAADRTAQHILRRMWQLGY